MNEYDLMSCLKAIVHWWDEELPIEMTHCAEPDCIAKARALVDISRGQNAEKAGRIVYTSESETRRSDVEEVSTHFRVWFGENGTWSKTYRVTNDLEKARMFADGWVARTTVLP